MNAVLGLRGGFDSNASHRQLARRVAVKAGLTYMDVAGNEPALTA